ncbi:MAG: SurA N-terminal domain-containing protein, partial [Deltaproteobacteria bacterium]|nr:SurA N-terminal domain-containing protein [Deltaproteobacteria bacterium]
MLTTMRNYAQSWPIKLLLGLVIITFVISFGAISLTYRKEVLATVGSEEILIPQFQKRYQAELDKLR